MNQQKGIFYGIGDGKSLKYHLRDLTWKGIKSKYGRDIAKSIAARVELELRMIDKAGLIPYFLMLKDFVDWAASRDILIGPGRGAMVGSIVNYALDITAIDPIKYNLIFQRFINPTKIGLPYFGFNVPRENKQDAQEYLYGKFGHLEVEIGGLKSLTLLSKMMRHLKLKEIPINDKKTFELFADGNTAGTFNFALSGMPQFLRKTEPANLSGLADLLALWRPGPRECGLVEEYVGMKSGGLKCKYDIPKLKPILQGSYDCIIYQEQIMQIAHDIGGFSMNDADLLRRKLGAKKPHEEMNIRMQGNYDGIGIYIGIKEKQIVVLAPTGVAALNVKGQTIHSFFKFKPDINLDKIRKTKKSTKASIYRQLDAIVIDEISMVRSDLLDCIDKFLRLHRRERNKPFGGAQMIFIGDLYQLPPVVTREEKGIFTGHYKSQYFFDAKVMEHFTMEYIELEKIYRQKDAAFIEILNAFRNKSADIKHVRAINQRYDPDFTPGRDEYIICLTTTNAMAMGINERELEKIKGEPNIFTAAVDGEVDRKNIPTEKELSLKNGAQVMMLNNDSLGRWVNGTLGRISLIAKDSVLVEFENGKIEEVIPYTWEIFHFTFDQETNTLASDIVGTFTQLPLKLAWAVTIHKSQGLTFDKVMIDIGSGTFAHGQLYVALSRCRTLGGMVLKKRIAAQHALMDYKVRDFVTRYQYRISEENCSTEEKLSIINAAIKDKKRLEITYLKASDERSKRRLSPITAGQMEYKDKSYLGMKAYCHLRKKKRVFRIDRILDIKVEN